MNFFKNLFHVGSVFRIGFILVVLFLSACAGTVKKQIADEQVNVQIEMKKQFEQAVEHQNNGKYDQAKAIYQSLLSQNSALISPSLNLGIIAVKQTQTDEAKKYFDAVLSIDPKQNTALTYLALLAREAGKFDQAESYLRQILEVEPNNLNAIRNLGILLDLYRGRLAEALVLYEKYQSLQVEPDPQLKDWIFDTRNRLKAVQ